MKKIIIALTVFATSNVMCQVTFTEDISPIIYNKCTVCHRPGQIGPFSLTNYSETSAWGTTILDAVVTHETMPPWPPNPDFQHFLGEAGRIITPAEKQLLIDWVGAGTPQGDPALEAPMPVFPSGSAIGVPDVVLTMAEPYTVLGNNQDDFRVYVIPTGFLTDKEIAAIELIPSNNRTVHHALFAYDLTGDAAAQDALDPTYGYQSFGDFGIPNYTSLSMGFVPGGQQIVFPQGIGEIIPAGADLLLQVHYAPLPTDETDQSSINIFFKDGSDPITRELIQGSASPYNLAGGWNSFQIPANSTPMFHTTDFYEGINIWPGFSGDISLISVEPHAHYLGASFLAYFITPVNDTIPVIDIPHWDFHWQGAYSYPNMKKIPAGSILHCYAGYDNTTANHDNPNNPPISVAWGDGSEDEMLILSINYVPYQIGDELIEISAALDEHSENQNPIELLDPVPNPASDETLVSFTLTKPELLGLNLYDANGEFVKRVSNKKNWSEGLNSIALYLKDLDSGIYIIQLYGTSTNQTKKILVNK